MTLKIDDTKSRQLSICKLMSILLVVMIHAYFVYEPVKDGSGGVFIYITNYISQVFSRSAVPLFFTISAFFLYSKEFTWAFNMKKKLKSLVIPYFLINAIWIAVFALAQLIPQTKQLFTNDSEQIVANWSFVDWLNKFLCFLPDKKSPFLGQFWFLKDLIVLNLLSKPILFLVKKLKFIPGLVFFVLLLLKIGIPYPLNVCIFSMQSVFFFTLGCYIAVYNDFFEKILKIKFPITSAAYFVLSVLDLLNVSSSGDNGIVYSYFFLHIITIIVGMLFFYQLSGIIVKRCPTLTKLLLSLSTYSFFLYAFHEYTLTFSKKLFILLAGGFDEILYTIAYFAIPAIVTLLVVAAGMIFNRLLPKTFAFITGGRVKKPAIGK